MGFCPSFFVLSGGDGGSFFFPLKALRSSSFRRGLPTSKPIDTYTHGLPAFPDHTLRGSSSVNGKREEILGVLLREGKVRSGGKGRRKGKVSFIVLLSI